MAESPETFESSGFEQFTPTENDPIKLTPAAIVAVKNIMQEEGDGCNRLRVSVVGGGCSGFKYDLNFDEEEREDDTIINYGDVSVVIDPISARYLEGTVIDFLSGLSQSGFKFNNPNVKRTCGCGASFS
jgi:iron-sulfur cluster assembly accessory protein